MRTNTARILVLSGSDSLSARHLRALVERRAAEMGLAPIFVQCRDLEAVQALAATAGYRIMPLDDVALGIAARLSPRMERPLLEGDPAALEDKWGQRCAFARYGVPSPPFDLVEAAADVLRCGEQWGYPLMLKPARGTASHGVRRVDSREEVVDTLAVAQAAARASGQEGVLAEGYLDGPDVAVESMVLDGVSHHVSFSQSGWDGNLWRAAAPMGAALQRHLAAMADAVTRANAALGLRWAATSNELRLTAGGPMMVEVNARLGGEATEDAVCVHTGVDRVAALLSMLAGATPQVAPRHRRPVAHAAIRADEAGIVRAVEVPVHLAQDPKLRLELRAAPGGRIADPAAFFIGWLVLAGEPGEDADDLLPRSAAYARQIRTIVAPFRDNQDKEET